MSVMNCSAAVQAVLDRASARMDSLMLIHVDASESAPPLALSRRLTLPLSRDAQLAFALGCAQAGLRPVLDLTAVRDAGERLEAAFAALPKASRAPLVIRLSARRCPALPGAHVIAPANARECAGAMRFALRAELISVIVENPLSAYEACEVPDDPDELFAGATRPEAADTGASSEPEPDAREEAAGDGGAFAPEETAEPAPAPTGAPAGEPLAFRVRPYDPAGLVRVAALLGMGQNDLAALCCARAGEAAELDIEPDAAPGEAAWLPPEEKAARLWVGRDRLALCWRTRALTPPAARDLLGEAAARLETPERLILERKA